MNTTAVKITADDGRTLSAQAISRRLKAEKVLTTSTSTNGWSVSRHIPKAVRISPPLVFPDAMAARKLDGLADYINTKWDGLTATTY